MSKLYQEYLKLKEKNPTKMYLFRCGKFYIFLDEDCDKINDYVVLKKVSFSKDVYKCGFPSNALENYLRVFHNHKLNIEVIEEITENKTDVISCLINIDIDHITPIEALIKLKELKDLIK